MGLNVIVLAAGEGRRMCSRKPKVLADLAGRSLLAHALGRAALLGAERIRVVVGHGADAVRAALPDSVETVLQPEQRGTGDAVASALGGLNANDTTLVLYGDVPLVQRTTLEALIDAARRSDLAVLSVDLADASGYGRIVRDAAGGVSRIVEERDATPAELALTEVNTGLLAMRTGPLARHVAALDRDNAQGEYYLTDVIARVSATGGTVASIQPEHEWEVRGVNTRAQLAALERAWQRHVADGLMAAGVSLRDPERIDVRGTLQAGPDCLIDVGCVFEGDVRLGGGVTVGAHCVLRDTSVADDAVIEPHTVIDQSELAAACAVGPFARLRPGTRLGERARIGNFVETKKAELGAGAKVNHLSYVGDTAVGAKANVGAGVITCNYDGHRKYCTVIGADAFVGSDCQLIAPVTVGQGATVGAGTTLTSDAPPGKLTVGRARQRTIEGWTRPADRDPGDAE